MHRILIVLSLLFLTGCSVPLPRPVPERSILAVPEKHVLYLPLARMDAISFGRGAAVPHEYTQWGCEDAQKIGTSWLYDWGPQPPECPGVKSLPMIWRWTNMAVCPQIAPGDPILLFNEPSGFDQANMNPLLAAEVTYFLTEICFPNRRFATPAGVATDTQDGLIWLTQWWDYHVQLYGKAPRVELLAYHCFTWGTADGCIRRIDEAIAWGKARNLQGMLITEMAVLPCLQGDTKALVEAERLIQALKSRPYVLGWAWTSTRIKGSEGWWFKPADKCNTSLLDFVSGELTSYGAWYIKH